MLQLTREQQAIVACDLEPGEILKVKAFAGTGKTATLVAYAKARPHLRFLYVAFNKSVQLEAVRKFPANVVARTAHALAFRTHGHPHKARLTPGLRANTVMAALGLSIYEDARFATDTLYNYLISADAKVTRKHIPHQAPAFYSQRGDAMPDFVAIANRLGRLMCEKNDDRIGMLHDGYLKLYQLSDPVLDYDCILLDEAQDINPVTSALVMSQARSDRRRKPSSIILVGDSHQQIYSFRGARDSLDKIKSTRTMYLTQSFRFDNNIARVANMVLRLCKGEKRPIVGTPYDKDKPKWDPKGHTIIARTNATLFDKAVSLPKDLPIAFVGGIQGYRLNTLKDVYDLYADRREKINSPYIKGFAEYSELKAYARAVEEIELLSICKVVETHRSSLPGLVDGLVSRAVSQEKARVLLTTAHKAKGLQWPCVLMMDDFLPLVQNGRFSKPADVSPDEFNLIYVAMTRAIHNLRFDKSSTLPTFIQLAKKQTHRE